MPSLDALPKDLTRIVWQYMGSQIPLATFEKLSSATLERNALINFHMQVLWGAWGWSPTHCNRLIMTHGKGYTQACRYSAVTGLTPTSKAALVKYRESKGFVPVWPGDRQYPTSRLRFNPAVHTNDRYFR